MKILLKSHETPMKIPWNSQAFAGVPSLDNACRSAALRGPELQPALDVEVQWVFYGFSMGLPWFNMVLWWFDIWFDIWFYSGLIWLYYGFSHGFTGIMLGLVGGMATTPLKNMSSSIGMMKFPGYWKLKFMFQTTNHKIQTMSSCSVCVFVDGFTISNNNAALRIRIDFKLGRM